MDIFPDKPKKNIDWASLIPQKSKTEECSEFDQINPINILKKANVNQRKTTLIRNKSLLGILYYFDLIIKTSKPS